MRERWPLLLLVGGSAALVWTATGELPWPARALTTFLLVPLPALLLLQARLITDVADLPRLSLYASSAAAQWLLAVCTAVVAVASSITAYALGLDAPVSWTGQLAWAAALTAAAVGLNLASHRLGIRESPVLTHLLPRTRTERAAFVGLSLTAGFCEELVFRGFLITALYAASGSLVLALIVSSAAFGVVHAYQEPGGVARATLLGLLLATPFVLTGSLAASMVAHAAIDIVGGCWLGPRLLRLHR